MTEDKVEDINGYKIRLQESRENMYRRLGLLGWLTMLFIRIVMNISTGHAIMSVVLRDATFKALWYVPGEPVGVITLCGMVVLVITWIMTSYCLGGFFLSYVFRLIDVVTIYPFVILTKLKIKRRVLGESPSRLVSEIWDWGWFVIFLGFSYFTIKSMMNGTGWSK